MKTKRFKLSRFNRLTAMVWKFIKTNWFYLALSLMIVGALMRKSLRPATVAPGQVMTTEKFTATTATQEEGISLFGGLGDGARPLQRFPEIDAAVAENFLRRFGKVTPGEQQKFGIPASVLLAAAYVNSFAGERDMAKGANNYYAMPCSGDWQGRTASYGGRCYRQYERAWDSFRDFSQLVRGQSWFAEAHKNAGGDWKSWVKALDGKGLSDVENFGAEMEKVIRAYRLFELDKR